MKPYNEEKMTELDYSLLKKKYSEGELGAILAKIDDDYPVQYAIGDVDFLGLKIKVDERALIPRFETELLVSKLYSYIREMHLENLHILDLCTGSGCIAVALKYRFPSSDISAIDKSEEALDLARENAVLNGVNVDFQSGDVLKSINVDSEFDVLVSNPPYVKLSEEVSPNTRYEPQMALYPGEDDTIFYKRILEQAREIMKPKFIIAFEIGSTQGEIVSNISREIFPECQISLEKDYAGLDRFVFIKSKGE